MKYICILLLLLLCPAQVYAQSVEQCCQKIPANCNRVFDVISNVMTKSCSMENTYSQQVSYNELVSELGNAYTQEEKAWDRLYTTLVQLNEVFNVQLKPELMNQIKDKLQLQINKRQSIINYINTKLGQ